ncbi:hypothetical protein [Synechococcus sp. PCC 7336]|uniref:hypothetical protein n=1 Tax=Synechococcus sp. PCC 7336 TaxID=195250 RepID=UPI00036E97BA|nr:hypothetical protein [Synechococcus sp. PCC 7336]
MRLFRHVLRDAKRFSLVEFYQLAKHQNQQTKYIAGFPVNRILGLYGGSIGERNLLKIAKHNLTHNFDSFGILEFLSEYQSWFCDRHGFQNTAVRDVKTKTKVRPKIAELSDFEISEIRRCNALDFQLYDFARQLFVARYMANRNQKTEDSA